MTLTWSNPMYVPTRAMIFSVENALYDDSMVVVATCHPDPCLATEITQRFINIFRNQTQFSDDLSMRFAWSPHLERSSENAIGPDWRRSWDLRTSTTADCPGRRRRLAWQWRWRWLSGPRWSICSIMIVRTEDRSFFRCLSIQLS